MEDLDLFGNPVYDVNTSDKYTSKVDTPIYEPKSRCPHILELVDSEKVKRMIMKINNSNVSDMEKKFLIEAAHRHSVFNYSKIADYYAYASKEMQELMEESALVIIDFDKSIELGFTKLQEKLHQEYLHNKYIKEHKDDEK